MKPTFRCSSLGSLMTESKTKLKSLIKQDIYAYKSEIDCKYMSKGKAVENESIRLYNQVKKTNHEKNNVRIIKEFENFILSGECDILSECIIDIKSAWSLETFPAWSKDAHKKDYEWQLRGYMYLYDKPESQIAYCMVSTPEELCKYEPREIHFVDHISPELRVTTIDYTRDSDIENKMLERLDLLGIEYKRLHEELIREKGLDWLL